MFRLDRKRSLINEKIKNTPIRAITAAAESAANIRLIIPGLTMLALHLPGHQLEDLSLSSLFGGDLSDDAPCSQHINAASEPH